MASDALLAVMHAHAWATPDRSISAEAIGNQPRLKTHRVTYEACGAMSTVDLLLHTAKYSML